MICFQMKNFNNEFVRLRRKGKVAIGDKIQYERTQISIANVVFEKVKDSVYTKPYLEMMSQR